jgi:hypothetical protein
MSSLEESWEEGGLIVTSTLRPEESVVVGQLTDGASDSFLKAVKETVLLVQNYFPHSGGSSWPSVAEVVATDQIYGEDRANKFAENHSWTEEQLKSDLTAYQESGYDIGTMVALRHQTNKSSRMNLERVGRLRKDNPQIGHLTSLCTGMIVPLPPNFRPNAPCDKEIERLLCMQKAFFAWATAEDKDNEKGVMDPTSQPCAWRYERALKPSYLRTHKAVDMMLNILVNQEACFLIHQNIMAF